jgi:signal transduction histidine kinase
MRQPADRLDDLLGPDAVMSILTDITAQRRMETELERCAHVAAHDLREPLLAINLFVEQLAAGLDRGRDERNRFTLPAAA